MPENNFHFRIYNVYLTLVSSALSILGALLIFLTYKKGTPKIRNFTRLLLVYLTVADTFTALGNFVAAVRYYIVHGHRSYNEHCSQNFMNISNTTNASFVTDSDSDDMLMGLCKGQSFVTTFSNMASFLWTLVIALHLWSSVVFKAQWSEATFMHVFYHVICWLIPLSIVITLLEKDYLGEDFCYGTGVWCGIRSDLDSSIIELWMYIADIGWQVPCYIIICILYMHLKLHLYFRHRGKKLNAVSNKFRNEDGNFVYIWLIIYLLKLWGMTRFFITTYVPLKTLNGEDFKTFLEVLLAMQSYGASGQAFWNCILFCFFDKTVKQSIKELICKRSDEEDETTSLIHAIN